MTKDTSTGAGRRTKLIRIGIAAALVAVLLVAGGIWWFFGRSAPDAVNVDDAAAALESTTTTAAGASPDDATTTTAAAPTLDGTWTVDTSIGTFSFADATSSFAGFRVEEELSGIGSTTAVGRSPAVAGSLTLEGATLAATSIEVDLSAIVTNESRRDRKVQEALGTSQFPVATFVLSEPIDMGAIPAPGETFSVAARGDLTIRGITNPVEFALDARLVDDIIVVVGSTNIVFADFEVQVPTAPIVLSAEDNGIVEFQLFFRRS